MADVSADPVIRPALDGIFAAFETHPLVGLGDRHGLANEGEFYNRLIGDPRFAADVGNVVVEFGGAAHQDTLDRYLSGEEVPYGELRQVWSNVVGWVPTVISVMYQHFFAQVRVVNARLSPEQRIRVWLGEPPIDWSTIRNREDLEPYLSRRDEHPAQIINREILARGKRALVIYGAMHFHSFPPPPGLAPRPGLKELVERDHPAAFYLVEVYTDYAKAEGTAAFESELKWPNGTLAAPVRGTSLEAALLRFWRPHTPPLMGTPALAPDELARLLDRVREIVSGVAGDALLYLGPAASLMTSPGDPALVMDEAYFREISRRYEIMTGQPADLAEWIRMASGPPRRYSLR
jgi:hypothetical protein